MIPHERFYCMERYEFHHFDMKMWLPEPPKESKNILGTWRRVKLPRGKRK